MVDQVKDNFSTVQRIKAKKRLRISFLSCHATHDEFPNEHINYLREILINSLPSPYNLNIQFYSFLIKDSHLFTWRTFMAYIWHIQIISFISLMLWEYYQVKFIKCLFVDLASGNWNRGNKKKTDKEKQQIRRDHCIDENVKEKSILAEIRKCFHYSFVNLNCLISNFVILLLFNLSLLSLNLWWKQQKNVINLIHNVNSTSNFVRKKASPNFVVYINYN